MSLKLQQLIRTISQQKNFSSVFGESISINSFLISFGNLLSVCFILLYFSTVIYLVNSSFTVFIINMITISIILIKYQLFLLNLCFLNLSRFTFLLLFIDKSPLIFSYFFLRYLIYFKYFLFKCTVSHFQSFID